MTQLRIFFSIVLAFPFLFSDLCFAQQKFETAKTAEESWTEYLDRLLELEMISSEQRSNWEAGDSLTNERAVTVEKFPVEQRTRTVRIQGMRTEVNGEGESVNVPYTAEVDQEYTVSIPYTERIQASESTSSDRL